MAISKVILQIHTGGMLITPNTKNYQQKMIGKTILFNQILNHQLLLEVLKTVQLIQIIISSPDTMDFEMIYERIIKQLTFNTSEYQIPFFLISLLFFLIFIILLLLQYFDMNTYNQAIKHIIKLTPVKFQGFKQHTHFKQLIKNLGQPHKNIKYIHITGTNGKGSVALKLAKILQYSNLKTGLYTSPHLFSFTQRIQVNSQSINKSQFLEIFNRIHYQILKRKLNINFFELITAISFLHFKNKNVNYVSLQVGIGGLYDSTNIIDPTLSVITSIGLDHTQLLGNTLKQIATQKAGIIKQNAPTVIGPYCDPIEVFQKTCKQKNSELYKVEPNNQKNFNNQNNRIVLKCIQVLKKYDHSIKISEIAIKNGLNSKQKCRMQIFNKQQYPQKIRGKYEAVVFDVGHNPPALQKLCSNLKVQFRDKKLIFAYGASSQKDSESSIKILSQYSDKIYLIQADHFRSASIQKLIQNQEQKKTYAIQKGNIAKTIQYILQYQQMYQILIICGSFYIMTEAQGYFNPIILETSDSHNKI